MFLRYSCTLSLVFAVTMTGCGTVELISFGPVVDSAPPTGQQVEWCRDTMFINAELEITPMGFHREPGIDDMVCFKFIAHTTDLASVFHRDVIDHSEFSSEDMTFLRSRLDGGIDSDWWDHAEHELVGGAFNVPVACGQCVGFAPNSDGTHTVYVLWHQT